MNFHMKISRTDFILGQVNFIDIADLKATEVDPKCFKGSLICNPGLQEPNYKHSTYIKRP